MAITSSDKMSGRFHTIGQLPLRIVLVQTSHAGNIGSVARAMKTMCLEQLHLVKPKNFPHADATAMASGADDLLASAHVWDSLSEAVADCGLVLGASARLRSLAWPVVEPREAAAICIREACRQPVALVFGNEQAGLSNEELALCHQLLNIPTNTSYGSLNLAMAVQIVCYELAMSSRESPGLRNTRQNVPMDARATSEQMNYFYEHLQKVMIELEFLDPAAPRRLMHRMRRLFGRARLETTELNILRGVLTAVEKHVKKSG